jgi:hypothetical protein
VIRHIVTCTVPLPSRTVSSGMLKIYGNSMYILCMTKKILFGVQCVYCYQWTHCFEDKGGKAITVMLQLQEWCSAHSESTESPKVRKSVWWQFVICFWEEDFLCQWSALTSSYIRPICKFFIWEYLQVKQYDSQPT